MGKSQIENASSIFLRQPIDFNLNFHENIIQSFQRRHCKEALYVRAMGKHVLTISLSGEVQRMNIALVACSDEGSDVYVG